MENYQFLEKIGEGTYGTVYRARDVHTGALVALKRFKESDLGDAQVARTAAREVATLRALRHESVVALLDAFRHRGKLVLVFEHLEATALAALERAPRGLEPADAARLLWQLAGALAHLHARGVVHRDVKPENLLLSAAGVLKLCDFGFARPLDAAGAAGGRYTAYVATRWYRAPELLAGAGRYGAGVDVWAFGCLAAELLTGRPLFPGASDVDQLARLLRAFPAELAALHGENLAARRLAPPEPDAREGLAARLPRLAPRALALVEACLAPDPASRPSAAALLEHPFFEDRAAWLTPAFAQAQAEHAAALAARAARYAAAGTAPAASATASAAAPGGDAKAAPAAIALAVDARGGAAAAPRPPAAPLLAPALAAAAPSPRGSAAPSRRPEAAPSQSPPPRRPPPIELGSARGASERLAGARSPPRAFPAAATPRAFPAAATPRVGGGASSRPPMAPPSTSPMKRTAHSRDSAEPPALPAVAATRRSPTRLAAAGGSPARKPQLPRPPGVASPARVRAPPAAAASPPASPPRKPLGLMLCARGLLQRSTRAVAAQPAALGEAPGAAPPRSGAAAHAGGRGPAARE